jgi:hypothetical protein
MEFLQEPQFFAPLDTVWKWTADFETLAIALA